MVFASITFLYWFLPVVVLVYCLLPQGCKNGWLLLASLFFYGWGEGKALLILVISILIGYGIGLGMEKMVRQYRAALLWIGIVIEAGFLLYFKYMDTDLPVGISFYTFQLISYLVDIYRGDTKAQRNLIDFAMYICLFTQLVAGPIVRYTEIEGQIKERKQKAEDIRYGIRRIILGLSKKVILADNLGELYQTVKGLETDSILGFWLSAVAFTLQIYFDFSGYSDMAIGLGRIFGFRFPENFDYPYGAGSITEFWQRWHMSLTRWFRDYIYIPLGGNRCSTWKWIRNILIVWMLTGLWHGARWNFVLWGLYFAVLLIIEKKLQPKIDRSGPVVMLHPKKPVWKQVIGHIYVIVAVIIGFVIFEETDMTQLGSHLAGMIGIGQQIFATEEVLYYLKSYGVLLILGVVGSLPFVSRLCQRVEDKKVGNRIITVLEPVVWVGLLFIATAYLVDGTFHPFLYFRF